MVRWSGCEQALRLVQPRLRRHRSPAAVRRAPCQEHRVRVRHAATLHTHLPLTHTLSHHAPAAYTGPAVRSSRAVRCRPRSRWRRCASSSPTTKAIAPPPPGVLPSLQRELQPPLATELSASLDQEEIKPAMAHARAHRHTHTGSTREYRNKNTRVINRKNGSVRQRSEVTPRGAGGGVVICAGSFLRR
jgi:hypothetical protein